MSTPSGYRSKGYGDDRKVYPVFDPTQNVGRSLKSARFVDSSREAMHEARMQRYPLDEDFAKDQIQYDYHGKARLVSMSPQQFLQQCPSPNYFSTNKAETGLTEIGYNRKIVDAYKAQITSGEPLKPMELDYLQTDRTGRARHDGRHRAKAAMELGIQEIPVIMTKNDKAYAAYVARSLHGYDVVKVETPTKMINLKLAVVNVDDIKPSQHFADVEERAKFFENEIKQEHSIPPMLVHKTDDGKYVVADGHARLLAFQRCGVKKVPVVENSLSDVLGKIGHGVSRSAGTVGRGISGVHKGFASGLVAPKEGVRRATRVGSVIGAGARKAGQFGKRAAKFGIRTTKTGVKIARKERLKQLAKSKDVKVRTQALKELEEQ